MLGFNTATAEVATEEGSTFKVPLTTILDIQPHTNADRLEIATVYGFQVVVGKGRYKVGDKTIYIPVDSILSQKLEDLLFPPDSKIKLDKHRVRQIRIRGLASQGMLIAPSEIESIVNAKFLTLEKDLKDILGVTKYQPPERGPAYTQAGAKKPRKNSPHPDFHQYNSLDNIKWFPDKFKDGDNVVIQEKLHGTNARAALMKFRKKNLLHVIKGWFNLNPEIEKLYGSNRVDISNSSAYKGWYGEDVYGAVFQKIDVFSKLKLGETVFGEIIGKGIQKGYEYSLNEHKFVLFDVKVLQADGTQKWLTPDEVEAFAKERGFDLVPILYKGPYNKALAYDMSKGASTYDPSEKVIEGIVIKAADVYDIAGNKQALKWINEAYLDDKNNTDFH